MKKIIDWLQKAEIFICVFLMTITFIIILAHITARYVFHYPFFFAEEISIGEMPVFKSCVAAASAEFASTLPLTDCPWLLRPVY